jgi:hypothetical protein
MGRGKHSGLIFPLTARLAHIEGKANSRRKGQKTHLASLPNPNPRLGQAASRIRLGKRLREDTSAAGYVLEPRPTKVEDEDEKHKNEKTLMRLS